MNTPNDHNKFLKKIAKEQFKKHGIIQHGQSRIFLYDKIWYTIIIEFQPSNKSKGTFLNVGVDFNFYPRNYITFNFGYRENGFEAFENEEQFEKVIIQFCNKAIKRVQELNEKFKDIELAIQTIKKEKRKDDWKIYDLGILLALTQNFEESKKNLLQVSKTESEQDWEKERKKIVEELILWLDEKPTDLNHIKNLILQTRQLKKFPNVEFNITDISVNKDNHSNSKSGINWLKKLFN